AVWGFYLGLTLPPAALTAKASNAMGHAATFFAKATSGAAAGALQGSSVLRFKSEILASKKSAIEGMHSEHLNTPEFNASFNEQMKLLIPFSGKKMVPTWNGTEFKVVPDSKDLSKSEIKAGVEMVLSKLKDFKSEKPGEENTEKTIIFKRLEGN